MDQYSMRYAWRKVYHTLRKKHLRYHGPFYLRIVKKTATKVDPEYELHLFLCVETEDGQYHGLLEVSPRQYGKYKVGQYFCRGGVIQYTKIDSCYYMSIYDDAKIAIRKAVNSSRLRLAFIAFVLLIIIII